MNKLSNNFTIGGHHGCPMHSFQKPKLFNKFLTTTVPLHCTTTLSLWLRKTVANCSSDAWVFLSPILARNPSESEDMPP